MRMHYEYSTLYSLFFEYTCTCTCTCILLEYCPAIYIYTVHLHAVCVCVCVCVCRLEEGGQTALGPALLLSISMASRTPGSKVSRLHTYMYAVQALYNKNIYSPEVHVHVVGAFVCVC